MLTGIVRKMADQFFTALDDDINGLRPETPAVGAGPGLAAGTGLTASPELTTGTERDSAVGRPGASAPPAVGQVYAGRAGHSATASASAHLGMDSGAAFALGSVVGGALALIGVAVSRKLFLSVMSTGRPRVALDDHGMALNCLNSNQWPLVLASVGRKVYVGRAGRLPPFVTARVCPLAVTVHVSLCTVFARQ